jgi:hypothetical protein
MQQTLKNTLWDVFLEFAAVPTIAFFHKKLPDSEVNHSEQKLWLLSVIR